MVFHWILTASESSQVSRTLLSILADFNNTLVPMVSVQPPISNVSSSFIKLLGTVLSASYITGITVSFMFRNMFSSLARSRYLSLFSFSLIFIPLFDETVMSTVWQVLYFC